MGELTQEYGTSESESMSITTTASQSDRYLDMRHWMDCDNNTLYTDRTATHHFLLSRRCSTSGPAHCLCSDCHTHRTCSRSDHSADYRSLQTLILLHLLHRCLEEPKRPSSWRLSPSPPHQDPTPRARIREFLSTREYRDWLNVRMSML